MRALPLLLLAACTADRYAPAPAGQAVLDLSGAFSVQPWTRSRGAAGPLRLSGRFVLPEDRLGAGSVLELEGLWWTAAVTLNGVALPPVTGGNATVRLPVGEALKPGENELLIEISPPTTEMPIETGGGLSSSGFPADQPTLQAPPRLVLRPAAHVDWLAVGAQDGKALPQARISASIASGEPWAIASTEPSSRLRTQPSMPRRWASRTHQWR